MAAPPSDYFYKTGFYWKTDGTGPYSWNGTTMQLLQYPVAATANSTLVGRNLFNISNGSGPATRS